MKTMASIKMSDAMFISAQSVVDFGKKCGIQLNILDVYSKENIESVALIASFIKQLTAKIGKQEIQITKD